MVINFQQKPGSLLVSFIKPDGGVGYTNFTVPPSQQYSYQYAKTGGLKDLMSWDDKPVKRVACQLLDKFRIQEFLIDAKEENVKHLFEVNMPLLSCCDIETDVTDEGFCEPSSAANRVNSISWVEKESITAFGLKPLSAKQCQDIENDINAHVAKFNIKYKFLYKQYENEVYMLQDFFYNYARLATAITGWNFIAYDWQYLTNRCNRLGIDISFMSPTKKWKDKTIQDKNNKVKVKFPLHKLIFDYLEIYKKWDRTVEVKESATLDFVSELLLGIKKVKYPGTLQDLYNKDYEKYIFYNCIDSVLVQLLDKKLKTMSTMLGLGNITRIETMDAFSPISMFEATMARYAYNVGKVFPKDDTHHHREEYEGAFVFEPTPGLYEWVSSFDYKSLYPSVARQFMMSFDNLICKDKDHVCKPNEIKTISGAVFDKGYYALLPAILTDYFGMRVTTKNVSTTAELNASKLKDILKKRQLESQI
jgi:DNA polymerase elongation subunit (family B)